MTENTNTSDCIFCRIIRGELDSAIVYEDESTLAFMDLRQSNEGHVLVVPKRHFEQIYDLDDDTAVALRQFGLQSCPGGPPRLRTGRTVYLAVQWSGSVSGGTARSLACNPTVYGRWTPRRVSEGPRRTCAPRILVAIAEEHCGSVDFGACGRCCVTHVRTQRTYDKEQP